MDKIYVLTCTYENHDCIRETNLLHASFNREYLRSKLREYVDEDADGLFEEYGFASNEPDYVCSEWDDYDGFEEYTIVTMEIEDGKREVFKADDLSSVLEV